METMNDAPGKLKSELHKLDQLEVEVPNQEQINRRLAAGEKQERRKFLYDLSAFFLVACAIVAGLSQLMMNAPVLFFILQAVVILLLPALAFYERRRTLHSGRWRL